ncbi:hypothetical protein GCM10007971_25900 [Oceanobacillus indicireducens]|uniref:Uncharacterized protein n=1 Tax=Oceanobacillus indicireducens TaxID=1004261 RepID=A0A918D368_9BACI|nr:hypothetical protein GCM10007971_25900 [Oceanobacillus indicireducens]
MRSKSEQDILGASYLAPVIYIAFRGRLVFLDAQDELTQTFPHTSVFLACLARFALCEVSPPRPSDKQDVLVPALVTGRDQCRPPLKSPYIPGADKDVVRIYI